MSGTTSGVIIRSGTDSQPSGMIAFSLDASKASTLTLNFDTGQMTFDFNLLATFPLQGALGASPVPIEIVETGAFPAFNLTLGPGASSFSSTHQGQITQPGFPGQSTSGGSSGTLALPAPDLATFFLDPTGLSGSGIVTTGPFAGFQYANEWFVEAEVAAKVSYPGGSVSGSISISNGAEPSSLFLLGTGASLLAGYLYFRQRTAKKTGLPG